MKIYYIAVSSWDGNHYTLDCIRPFLTKQKRNETYEKMRLSAAYENGDICLNVDEDEVEDVPEEAVEGIVENWSPEPHPEITIPLNPEEYSNGDKVRVIVLKKED